jgi:hypothetical protein
MRIESSVTSVSWIPSEAIRGLPKAPFELGVTHYDEPPPDRIDDLDALHARGAFRFANRLAGWVEVRDGRIVDAGHAGRSYISTTQARLGSKASVVFQPIPFPDLVRAPEVSETAARFVQTAGGRPGIPAPRRVRRKPYVQWVGPIVWSTLALTIHVDGTTEHEVLGASPFPRHWIYDDGGTLIEKSGLIDFKEWYVSAFGAHSPWGDEDTPALVTAAETALERELSSAVMRGGRKPRVRRVKQGRTLVKQGEPGNELYLLLDGVLAVLVDGEKVGELGPGAIVGERSVLEGGTRTATLRAVSDVRVAVAGPDDVDRDALTRLAEGHHREDG